MKIQAINTSFKGLFMDKSKENNGKWRMEYSPYSWERDQYGGQLSKKDNQTNLDIASKDLPDNEKIYKATYDDSSYYSRTATESCDDILGTRFYYCDYKNNRQRKTITEVPAMNLEESLKVKNQKLREFVKLKEEQYAEYDKSFKIHDASLGRNNRDFYDYSNDYDKNIIDRSQNKQENKRGMYNSHWQYTREVDELRKTLQNYKNFRNSTDAVRDLIIKNQNVINELQEARLTGNLIDISRRDVEDPNKPLWDALQDVKSALGKIIALPHEVLSVKELLKKIGNNTHQSEIAPKAIRYVDEVINHLRYMRK